MFWFHVHGSLKGPFVRGRPLRNRMKNRMNHERALSDGNHNVISLGSIVDVEGSFFPKGTVLCHYCWLILDWWWYLSSLSE